MVGFWDAIVRILVGAILIWLGIEKGGIFVIGYWIGIILMLTAIIAFCPLYKIAGISTRCEEEACQ